MELEVAAPAETPASAPIDSASSTEIDYASMSDDDILNTPEDAPAERAAAQDAEEPTSSEAEAKPVETEAEEEKPEIEEPADEGYEPETLLKLYKNPETKADLDAVFKAHPEVRSAFFKASQVADMFPTIAEARELRNVFPTAEMAKAAAARSAAFANMDQEFTENPAGFAEKLAQSPAEFRAMMREAREVLFRVDPKAYQEDFGEPGIRDVLANARVIATEQGDEELQAALAIFDDRLGFSKRDGQRPTGPVDPRIQKYEEFEKKAQAFRQEAQAAFSSKTDQVYWDDLHAAVSSAVGKPATMTEKARAFVIEKAMNDVASMIAQRRELQPEYERLKRSGPMSDEHSKQVAGFLMAFARQHVGRAVQARVNEWTNEVLAGNKQTLQKAAATKSNRDVGGGSGNETPKQSKLEQARDPKTGRYRYEGLTDDDILNA